MNRPSTAFNIIREPRYMCAHPEQAERVCLRASELTGINTHTPNTHTERAAREPKTAAFPSLAAKE